MKALATWTFPEFERHERGRTWYVVGAIVVALLLIYSIVTANYLFALIVIILSVIVLVTGGRQPRSIRFSITEEGVELGSERFPYSGIDHFWFVYQPPRVKKLYLKLQKGLRSELAIELGNQNPVKIRELIGQFLPEDTEQDAEPFSDQISRWFKL